MKEIGCLTTDMDLESIPGRMEMFMKECFL